MIGRRFLLIGILFWGIPMAGAIESKAAIEEELYASIKKTSKLQTEAEVQQAVGHALLERNEWERAEKYLHRAVELNGKLYWAWYDLGVIEMNTQAGNGYFRKAIKVNPDFAPARYWLAYSCTRQGEFKTALPLWEQYLKVAREAVNKDTRDAEAERINLAEAVIKEIRSGKPGTEIQMVQAE